PIRRRGGVGPEEGEEGRPAGPRPHRTTVSRLRRHRPGGRLLRQVAPVLPHVPDRRQTPRRPPLLQVPEVAGNDTSGCDEPPSAPPVPALEILCCARRDVRTGPFAP